MARVIVLEGGYCLFAYIADWMELPAEMLKMCRQCLQYPPSIECDQLGEVELVMIFPVQRSQHSPRDAEQWKGHLIDMPTVSQRAYRETDTGSREFRQRQR